MRTCWHSESIEQPARSWLLSWRLERVASSGIMMNVIRSDSSPPLRRIAWRCSAKSNRVINSPTRRHHPINAIQNNNNNNNKIGLLLWQVMPERRDNIKRDYLVGKDGDEWPDDFRRLRHIFERIRSKAMAPLVISGRSKRRLNWNRHENVK